MDRIGKIRIDGIWWKWDEDKEVLRDMKGNERILAKGGRKRRGLRIKEEEKNKEKGKGKKNGL